MELLASLDSNEEATGILFWDDGESLDSVSAGRFFLGRISIEDRALTMTVEMDGYVEVQSLFISRVVILGIEHSVGAIIVNGEEHWDWSFQNGGLDITHLHISVNDNFEILF